MEAETFPEGATERGVYLAGPSGFTEPGALWHNTVLIPKVKAAGLIPIDPWADQSELPELMALPFGQERKDLLEQANLKLGRLDFARVEAAPAVLACLDGNDVDPGTALEVGYAHALGKLIVGFRTDLRLSADNEGSLVNLMLHTACVDSGGILTTSVDDAIAHVAKVLGVEAPERNIPDNAVPNVCPHCLAPTYSYKYADGTTRYHEADGSLFCSEAS